MFTRHEYSEYFRTFIRYKYTEHFRYEYIKDFISFLLHECIDYFNMIKPIKTSPFQEFMDCFFLRSLSTYEDTQRVLASHVAHFAH